MTSDTIISTIGIAVNIIGFSFVSRQLRMQALATRGETYTSLCGLSYDILKLITEEPLLYEYASALGGPLSGAQPLANGSVLGDAVSPFVLPYMAVVEVVITNTDGGEHPFHLHGHWFWVVATSAAPDARQLYGPHYVRRDVVSIPANGWARLRFVADNPGIWYHHCHIDWSVNAARCACAWLALTRTACNAAGTWRRDSSPRSSRRPTS